jgi:hypothetical protein
MENNQQQLPNSGMGLGIAGFVLGIIGLLLAFFPCTFVAGLILGILGASLSAVGLSHARKSMSPSGLILAGLIISVICVCLAGLKLTNTMSKHEKSPWSIISDKMHGWKNNMDESDNFDKNFNDEFHKELGGNMEDVLRKLEKDLDSTDMKLDKTDKNINHSFDSLSDDEKARILGKAAGKAVRAFFDEIADSAKKEHK